MASLQECEAALQALATRLAAVDPDLRRKHAVDRTVSCRLVDLDVVFHVRLTDGTAREIRGGADDGSEMGVYHDNHTLQRDASLRAAVGEHLPLGWELTAENKS